MPIAEKTDKHHDELVIGQEAQVVPAYIFDIDPSCLMPLVALP